MDKPAIVEVKKPFVEEREPPTERDYEFVEKAGKEMEVGEGNDGGFLERMRKIFGL